MSIFPSALQKSVNLIMGHSLHWTCVSSFQNNELRRTEPGRAIHRHWSSAMGRKLRAMRALEDVLLSVGSVLLIRTRF